MGRRGVWFAADLFVDYHGSFDNRCLLARDGHRMSLASLALKQRKMYFQHTKDTASAQSLKETVQQRKKLGGTLRFGRYYLLPICYLLY